jgi:hypothetical protein
MAEEKMTFQQFFESFGSQLLAGWLRARNDGNEEEFEHWVLGEYSVYMDVDKDMAELDDSGDDDDYEVPYHGIADSPAPAEALIWPKKRGGVEVDERATGAINASSH